MNDALSVRDVFLSSSVERECEHVINLKELLIKEWENFRVLYWHSRGRIYENRQTTLAG